MSTSRAAPRIQLHLKQRIETIPHPKPPLKPFNKPASQTEN